MIFTGVLSVGHREYNNNINVVKLANYKLTDNHALKCSILQNKLHLINTYMAIL